MKKEPSADRIQARLFALQDTAYRDFQKKLIPGIDEDAMIGVRTPVLRALAKKLYATEEAERFLKRLPHTYFDENQLHAFLLSIEKDRERCFSLVETFLPFVDNWATCDQMSPKIFKKYKPELLKHVKIWLQSDHVYTVRFAIGMLMQHFLDADFRPEYMEMVASVRSEEYYIHMEIAWYFATALAKQWETAIVYLEEHRLDPWTHRQTIRKALESFRVSEDHKAYLRTLRRNDKENTVHS
ncbi:MAG: DNA alkylation repair protein [Lachnospiraceae bacterium]|nr:DNA alkylation repair protein [Lachnospiraceae bacterium]